MVFYQLDVNMLVIGGINSMTIALVNRNINWEHRQQPSTLVQTPVICTVVENHRVVAVTQGDGLVVSRALTQLIEVLKKPTVHPRVDIVYATDS